MSLIWKSRATEPHMAELSYSGDYVISHRRDNFTLCFRPTGEHHNLGSFQTLEIAKGTAEVHAANPYSTPNLAL